MKRRVVLALIAAACVLTGCSGKEAEKQPSTEHLYVHELKETENTSSFWKAAPDYLPLVKYSDIESGEFDSCYVLMDGITRSVDDDGVVKSIAILFETGENKYQEAKFNWTDGGMDEPTFDDFTNDGDSKQTVRICVCPKNGSLENTQLIAIRGTGDTVDVDFYKVEISEPERPWEKVTEKPETGNLFLDAQEQSGIVYSGSGNIIGQYKYISVPRSSFDSATADQYSEFCEHVESLSKIANWYAVNFDDGTALVFFGCNTSIGTIGHQDGTGTVSDAISNVQLQNGQIVITDAQQGGE